MLDREGFQRLEIERQSLQDELLISHQQSIKAREVMYFASGHTEPGLGPGLLTANLVSFFKPHSFSRRVVPLTSQYAAVTYKCVGPHSHLKYMITEQLNWQTNSQSRPKCRH